VFRHKTTYRERWRSSRRRSHSRSDLRRRTPLTPAGRGK